mmetsp:Transcript_37891/g.109233  ORF Transcript_37891/g.109233 Transcript_37891/m.109233 type:complete len:260 (-) Transcript_37891:1339-2118(-)
MVHVHCVAMGPVDLECAKPRLQEDPAGEEVLEEELLVHQAVQEGELRAVHAPVDHVVVVAEGVNPEVRAQEAQRQGGSALPHVEEALVRDDHGVARLPEGQQGVPQAAGHELKEGHWRREQRQLDPRAQHLLLLVYAQAAARHLHPGRPARVRWRQQVVLEECLPVGKAVVDLKVPDPTPLSSVAGSIVQGLRVLPSHAVYKVLGPRFDKNSFHEVQCEGHCEVKVGDFGPVVASRPPLNENVNVVCGGGQIQCDPCCH